VIRARRPELRPLPVERCCQVLGVSRSQYYANGIPKAGVLPDELSERVMEAATQRLVYGFRRVAAHLRRQGILSATPKRVRVRMKRLGLSRGRKRRFVRTTLPGKGVASPNRAKDLVPTGPGQLLITDLTYVALPQGFGYVSVVLDAYSRRALGWASSRSLSTALPEQALRRAIATANLRPGWIHHSDRGCQYTSEPYQRLVRETGGILSHSRPANPYDNATMESFFKTYKTEEVNRNAYDSIEELNQNLEAFLNDYNSQRLHSSLGYRSPVEFEAIQHNKKPNP
jgi:putative transposase